MNLTKIGLLAAVAFALTTGTSHAANRYTLGTNPQGTIYYTIGGGIAAALQDDLGKQVTVQPYTGSSVYLPLISAGEVTMGLNSSLDLGDWYGGENGQELKSLRVLARLWPLRVAYTTRANDGATKVSDLAGKRVVTNFSALSAMSKLNQAMLELSGVPLDSVEQVTTAGLGPGMEGLTEGTLDATSVAVGIPLTQQAQATISGGIRYLTIDGGESKNEEADKVYPGMYIAKVDPNPRMPEVTDTVYVGGFDVFLSVDASLPDEDAAELLRALYEKLPTLKENYPPLGGASLEKLSAPTNTVPYHPAAISFFKEKGIWNDENERREKSLAD